MVRLLLRNVVSLLKPGGYFFGTTPDSSTIWSVSFHQVPLISLFLWFKSSEFWDDLNHKSSEQREYDMLSLEISEISDTSEILNMSNKGLIWEWEHCNRYKYQKAVEEAMKVGSLRVNGTLPRVRSPLYTITFEDDRWVHVWHSPCLMWISAISS